LGCRVRPRGICLGGKNAFLWHNFRCIPAECRKFNVINSDDEGNTLRMLDFLLGPHNHVTYTPPSAPDRKREWDAVRTEGRHRKRESTQICVGRTYIHTYKLGCVLENHSQQHLSHIFRIVGTPSLSAAFSSQL